MTVLLVDDDNEQLSLRALILQQHGFETLEAKTADEATRTAAAAASLDCALVDLCLPTVDAGLDAMRQLRSQAAGVRIIALTGYSAGSPQHAAARECADEVIVKGNGITALLASLSACSSIGKPADPPVQSTHSASQIAHT